MSEPKELKAKKLDALLQKDYGKSLWHFSLSLVWNYFIFRPKEFTGGKKIESLKNQTGNAVKIRDDFWKVLPNFPPKDEFLSIKQGLDTIIKNYNQILNSKECVGGRPRRNLNVILLAWQKNSNINYEKLIVWFMNRLIKFPAYKSFCDEVKDKFDGVYFQDDSFNRWKHRYMKKDTYERDMENCSVSFKNPVPTIAIYFYNDSIQTISLDQLSCKKDTPLITFPDGDALTIGDFEKNSEMMKAADKNRAHII